MELIANREVISVIGKEVAEINRMLGLHEQIKRIRLVAEEWTPVTGELSPTLKLKRNLLHKKYGELIQEIYRMNGDQ
jgi:long-chain acyl-CoA synthetase